MRRTKRTIVILGLALAGCRGPVLSPTTTPQAVDVRILATTSTYPLLQEFVEAYQPSHLLLAVEQASAGWLTVYERVSSGRVPFALTSYLPAQAELWAAPIGWDGIAVIVHASNTTTALDQDDLRLIFQGRVQSWSEVGGPELPVVVVSREDGDGARQAFESLVMNRGRVTSNARLALSGAGMVDIVGSIPGAVGYVTMAQLDDRVRALPLRVLGQPDPVAPTPETVSSGQYPLRTPLLVIGREPPEPDSVYWNWFAWMQSPEGQQIVGQRYGVLGS